MTTTLTPKTTIDEARVEQFAGRLLTDLAGAATIAMTAIGDRLGLYRALAGSGPQTAEQFAADTGLEPRLLTEWLAAQTVAGYVAFDPQNGTYELPAEHAMVLSEADSPAFLVPAADLIAAQYLMLERLELTFRTSRTRYPCNLWGCV